MMDRDMALEGTPVPKRKRRGGPNGSGCITCRVRHVRCDENKPSCYKCLKFCGSCSGYGRKITGSAPKAITRRPLMPKTRTDHSSISFEPKTNIFATESEHQSYLLFVTKTANSISGFFDSEIWNRIVLQACQTEPSIRHAVIAIGALDLTSTIVQDLKVRDGSSFSEQDEAAVSHHHFALQQYSKAIACMREAVAKGNQPLRTTLLASMLIICFETYHGDHAAALSQMRISLDILAAQSRSRSQSSDKALLEGSETIEDEICEAFDRLDTQAMSLPNPRSMSQHEEMMEIHEDAVAAMPKSFSTIRIARFYYNAAMLRMMHFRIRYGDSHQDSVARVVGSDDTIIDAPEEMKIKLAKLLAELASWRSAFDPLMNRLQQHGTEKEYLCCVSLEVQHAFATIVLATTLGKYQTSFDKHAPEFNSIVQKCRLLLAAQQKTSTNFLFDFQCIMPLYVAARKCRDPIIRREAIGLLLEKGWREGVWDSILAGKISKWMMEIEEEGIEDGFVPEWSRVRGAEVGFDLKKRSATARCLRRVSEVSEEMAVREVYLTW